MQQLPFSEAQQLLPESSSRKFQLQEELIQHTPQGQLSKWDNSIEKGIHHLTLELDLYY